MTEKETKEVIDREKLSLLLSAFIYGARIGHGKSLVEIMELGFDFIPNILGLADEISQEPENEQILVEVSTLFNAYKSQEPEE